jgi:hypothetical protein
MPASANDHDAYENNNRAKSNYPSRCGMSEQGIEGSGATHSDPQVFQDDSTKFHEDISRQYKAPFHIDGWLHFGLNE